MDFAYTLLTYSLAPARGNTLLEPKYLSYTDVLGAKLLSTINYLNDGEIVDCTIREQNNIFMARALF